MHMIHSAAAHVSHLNGALYESHSGGALYVSHSGRTSYVSHSGTAYVSHSGTAYVIHSDTAARDCFPCNNKINHIIWIISLNDSPGGTLDQSLS